MKKFSEWMDIEELSPSSPEAYYAEEAWNAALRVAREIVTSVDVEPRHSDMIVAEIDEAMEKES